MSTMTDPQSVVDVTGHDGPRAAAAAVAEVRAQVADWKQRTGAAHRELDELENVSGDDVLAAPAEVARIAERIPAVKTTIEMGKRALVTLQDKLLAAEGRWFGACADVLEEDLLEFARTVNAHADKTARLVRQLAEHECEYVPRTALTDLLHQLDMLNVGDTIVRPRSDDLEDQLEQKRRTVFALRELSEGRTPPIRNWQSGYARLPRFPLTNDVVDVRDYERRLGERYGFPDPTYISGFHDNAQRRTDAHLRQELKDRARATGKG